MIDNSVVKEELERLVKCEKYTIWQLCKKYNKSIHCTFYKFLNELYENSNEFTSIKKAILNNSKCEEIRFSKDYFSNSVLSGETFNDIAEKSGYVSGISLYKYLLELYKDDMDVYGSLKKQLVKNSKNEHLSSTSNVSISKNTRKKLVILLASDFITKFDEKSLITFTNSLDVDVEFRVLSFTVNLFSDKNFKLIEKLYSLPNIKFVEFGTFYNYKFDYNGNCLVTHNFLSLDKKNKTCIYTIDNDVILRYLSLNFESCRHLVVATNCKSLIMNAQRLDIRTLSFIDNNMFMIRFNETFNTNYSYTIIDTNVVIVYSDIFDYLKNKNYRYIISEAVIFEMNETKFLKMIYQANQIDGIVFDISKKFSYDDFIYNDVCILVNTIILSKRNLVPSFISTEDKTLRIEAAFCNMWNNEKYNDILTPEKSIEDETKQIKKTDEELTHNYNNEIPKEQETKDVNVTSDNDLFKTLIFSKFIGNYGLINTNICNNIEMVYNSKRIIIAKEKINTRTSKEQVYKTMVGYLIKFKEVDNLYEIITFNGKNNLKKTDLTL